MKCSLKCSSKVCEERDNEEVGYFWPNEQLSANLVDSVIGTNNSTRKVVLFPFNYFADDLFEFFAPERLLDGRYILFDQKLRDNSV